MKDPERKEKINLARKAKTLSKESTETKNHKETVAARMKLFDMKKEQEKIAAIVYDIEEYDVDAPIAYLNELLKKLSASTVNMAGPSSS